MVAKLSGVAPQNYRHYFEPFLGSGCLYLYLKPKSATLGDINAGLISMYKEVALDPIKVADFLYGLKPTKEEFLRVRENLASAVGAKQAAYFIFLNRHAFNGVYRENMAGRFNVPWSGKRKGQLVTIDQLIAFSDVLTSAKVLCSDFEGILDRSFKDDFVYLDPPYCVGENRNRGEYGGSAFTTDEFERLCAAMKRADTRGVKLLLSYNRLGIIRSLFPTWQYFYRDVRRSVSGNISGRGMAREFVFRNYQS